jgi:hypothetical protein
MKRIAVSTILGFCLTGAASAATFTVTNTSDSGAGSLRAAIDAANTNAGLDTIAFNVSGAGCTGGVCTIAPTSQLPNISSPVLIDGYTQAGSSANTVAQGALNTVLKVVISGSNIPGANGLSLISGGAGSTIRGLVINGFNNGIFSQSSNGNTVRGCFLGVNAAGTAKAPNNFGIEADFSNNFALGGPAPADRNLISGQAGTNIQVFSSSNVTIENNLIGPDISGIVGLGPTTQGIAVATNAQGTVIRGNVVGGASEGIALFNMNDGITGMTVQGNWIGTDVTGTHRIGNIVAGIRIKGRDIVIGGTAPGEGNVIAFNDGTGITVEYDFSNVSRNTIRGNSIYSNGEGVTLPLPTLGIDLSTPADLANGLTQNDLDDPDLGPNLGQNFPIISSAVSAGGDTTVHGRLNSTPSSTFSLDFYANDACLARPQDYLEGKEYIGSADISTDAGGDATINVVLDGVTLSAGAFVTATATDANGNTSEFSQRFVVSATPSAVNPPGNGSMTLSGFNFLPGATATVGGLPATNVVVNNYNQMTLTSPMLPPGTLNDITVTNADTSASTLPNGWIVNFLDVPESQQFNEWVNKLVRNEITVGVGGGNYGVGQNTLRQQMAVFLLKAKYGLCFVPPACTVPVFPDVPCSSNFAPWINELVAQGITTGCGGGNFCPTNAVNRQQMAVFLLKTLEGSSYDPPVCANATFTDVPCSNPFSKWIYELVDRGITAGCGGGLYCPLTNANRGQMATFVVKTFGLQ